MVSFIIPLVIWYNDAVLPLLRQFFLNPNRINKPAYPKAQYFISMSIYSAEIPLYFFNNNVNVPAARLNCDPPICISVCLISLIPFTFNN